MIWPRSLRARVQGFTLIELVVVLALVGLMVGFVIPFGLRALDNAQRRGAAADLGALLAAYPLTAYHGGRPLSVDTAQLRLALPDLPPDCSLVVPQALRYEANGMARGGRAVLTCVGDAARVFQVTPLTGEVRTDLP